MTEPTTPVKKFQWKWVGISFLSYALFYVGPLVVAGAFSSNTSMMSSLGRIFSGIWCLAGIVIVAGIVAYLSEGVTLWEPAVGAGLLVALGLSVAAYRIMVTEPAHRMHALRIIGPIVTLTAIAFVLSLFGARLGERAQKLWRKKPPEGTSNPGSAVDIETKRLVVLK